MTENQQIEYLTTALRIANIHIEHPIADLIIQVYRKIEEKKGDTDLMDISKIIAEMNRKYKIDK